MQTEYNGSMSFAQIQKIVERNMGLNTLFYIFFKNDKRILMATKYHSFINEHNEAKRIDQLSPNEYIWVITSELWNANKF